MGIKNGVLSLARSGKFFAKEHSPEILLVIGGISMVGSIISACKATLKFQETLKQHNERLDKLKVVEVHQKEGTANEEELAIDIKIARIAVYKETAKETVILYGPTVGLAAASIFCGLKAVGIVKKWYGGAVATIAALSKENEHLKTGIVEKYGEEALQALQSDPPAKVVDVDEETGEVTESEIPGASYSAFAKFFDESNPNWEKDAESNKNFLKLKENYANHLLHNRIINGVGHVFLNEVYSMLDIEETQAGQIMGWTYYVDPAEAKKHPESSGTIDFGIFNPDSPAARAFVNGYERSILLDFNVDSIPIVGRTGLTES